MSGPPVYPVALVVEGRPCLVVGGGRVAGRKIAGLLDAGAVVTVVAIEVGEAVRRIGGPVTVEERPYRPGEAAAYRLVVTATGVPEVDAAVAGDAEAAGVWVNSDDDPANCSLLLPAVHRDGAVTVAVSTGGASPALAGWLRDRAAAATGGAGVLADLLSVARAAIHDGGGSTEDIDWRAVLDGGLAALVDAGRIDDARALLDDVGGLPRSR